MGRCCGNRGRAVQPNPTYTSDTRLPRGVDSLSPGNTILGQSKTCTRCGGPMRVLHQYSSGGRNIQAYSCVSCAYQEDVPVT